LVQHDLHLTRPPQARQDAPLPVLYLRVSQERRSFLRRNGVDIEPGAPLEAGDLRELGHDLDVPVVKLAGSLVQRRGVQDEVERRRAQSPVQPAQRVREEPRKRFELELLALLEVGGMPLGQHPHLEREPRGEGRDGEELGVLAHDPAPVADLLMDDVDRKSTRLNSSHGYISYAVFCLKKKTPMNDVMGMISL